MRLLTIISVFKTTGIMLYLTLCVAAVCEVDKNDNPSSKERYQTIWDSLAHIEYQICVEKVELAHKLYLKLIAEGSEWASLRWTSYRMLAQIALQEGDSQQAYVYLSIIPEAWLSHREKLTLMKLSLSAVE